MTSAVHAMVRPVSQDGRTGEWERDITSLCGLAPENAMPFSTYQQFVTCPTCLGSEYLQLLKKGLRP